MTNIQGTTTSKRCLCIPVDDSGLFLGEKGVYLSATAIEMANPKFGDSHCIKASVDRAIYDAMSDEERKARPILGGMHELERRESQLGADSVSTIDPFAPGSTGPGW